MTVQKSDLSNKVKRYLFTGAVNVLLANESMDKATNMKIITPYASSFDLCIRTKDHTQLHVGYKCKVCRLRTYKLKLFLFFLKHFRRSIGSLVLADGRII